MNARRAKARAERLMRFRSTVTFSPGRYVLPDGTRLTFKNCRFERSTAGVALGSPSLVKPR